MPDSRTRRAAARAFRDRPADAGIYAVHGPGGAVWVGASPTLASVENRLWFTLRMGDCRVPGLQQAWTAAKGEGFAVAVLERFDPETAPYARERLLKDRAAHWRERLGARPA